MNSTSHRSLSASARCCPVCDSANFRPLRQHEFAPISGDLGAVGYTVGVCQDCGCAYASGIPTQAQFDRYYAEQSKYQTHVGDHASDYDVIRFRTIAGHLVEYGLMATSSVLDIGCATGGFLAELRSLGIQTLTGIDPSERCARIAQEQHGLDVRWGTIDSLIQEGKAFDVITLIGVLEHVRDARELLAKARALLRPDGFIYVASPDVESFQRCRNAPFQQFSTEHINFFSEASLKNLGTGAGLQGCSSRRWITQWSASILDSVVSVKYITAHHASEVEPERASERALQAYISDCEEQVELLRQRLSTLGCCRVPLIVWGAGSNTRFLLNIGVFRDLNIVAFVDVNPYLQGRILHEIPIVSPTEIRSRREKILICSKAFELDIKATIEKLNLGNEVIALYNAG
ncbi:MAG TPA: class I SAM-dependent methyltransferase [Opitutaceae bacterium]|nr:class I SAM-dependent methyltransferase [Opitutaceae bacterium]